MSEQVTVIEITWHATSSTLVVRRIRNLGMDRASKESLKSFYSRNLQLKSDYS